MILEVQTVGILPHIPALGALPEISFIVETDNIRIFLKLEPNRQIPFKYAGTCFDNMFRTLTYPRKQSNMIGGLFWVAVPDKNERHANELIQTVKRQSVSTFK
jgi:hypothetical protein